MSLHSNYELLEQIGEGGMATVHRARQRGAAGFDRVVAIKQMRLPLAARPDLVDRFVREGRIASALSHANIVQILELGESDGGFFIAMEYLEGWSLGRALLASVRAARAVPLDVVLSLLYQLCDALDHVHRRTGLDGRSLGVVHRDVSLGNLVVTRSGHLKLIDFGIAKTDTDPQTSDREVVGKPSYMAPEVIRRQPHDARADVFGFGVVAWELLTGRKLFTAGDEEATFWNVLETAVAPPSRYRPDCPRALDTIVLGALAKDPEHRTRSAAELRDQLETVIRDQAIDGTSRTVARWFAELEADARPRPASGPAPTAPFAALARRPRTHVTVARVTVIATSLAAGGVALLSRERSPHASGPPRTEVVKLVARDLAPQGAAAPLEPSATGCAAGPSPAPRPADKVMPERHHRGPQVQAARAPAVTRDARAIDVPEGSAATAIRDDSPRPVTEVARTSAPLPAPAAHPLTIRPDRVQWVAGVIAASTVRRLDAEAVPIRSIATILCIDEHGGVASVRFIEKLPEGLRAPLEHDVRAFRFTPYRVAGAAVPACFARRIVRET